MQIEAYKDKVKRLEEDLKKSNIKITEYSTEIIILKQYCRQVEEYKKKVQRKQFRKSK